MAVLFLYTENSSNQVIIRDFVRDCLMLILWCYLILLSSMVCFIKSSSLVIRKTFNLLYELKITTRYLKR